MTLYDVIEWVKSNPAIMRRIILCIILVTVAVSWYAIYISILRSGKARVEITTFPSNTSVQIGNLGTFKSGVVYIPHGEYRYKALADGYTPRTGILNTRVPGKGNIQIILANSDSARKYTAREDEEIMKIQGKAGKESVAWTKNYQDTHPIIKNLPIKDPYYRIGYLSDANGENFRVTVYTESPRYRYYATQRIRSLGYSLSDYRIDFIDYKSPLESISNE